MEKALKLIQKGQLEKARPILVDLLKEDDSVEESWFLLSYVLAEPHRKEYALHQALQLRPDFERAQQRLDQLRGKPPSSPPPATETPAFLTDFESEQSAPSFSPGQSYEDQKPPRSGRLRSILLVLLIIVLPAAGFWFGRDWLGSQLAGSGAPFSQATATPTVAFRELPPTWTPSSNLLESGVLAQGNPQYPSPKIQLTSSP
ncbi:MAG: hypothetical protein DWG76_05555 [Chloroflexi bacterium]|nr:hypothetical protein [Chloroflexota bacterium]